MDKIQGITELQILSKLIDDKTIAFVDRFNITEEYFNTPIYDEHEKPTGYTTKDIFRFIKAHYNQYKTTPTAATIIRSFPAFNRIEVVENDDYLVKTIKEEYNDLKFNDLWNKASDIYTSKGGDAATKFVKENIDKCENIYVGNIGIDLIHEGADKRLETYKKAIEAPNSVFVTTGLKELDDAIGGLGKFGELLIIQARLGSGKTFITLKMLYENWLKGVNVALFEPEVDRDSIGYRLDSYIQRFSNYKLRYGRKIDENYAEYIAKLKENSTKFMYISQKDFNSYTTVSKLKSFCKEHNIGLLAIDGINSDYLYDERASRDTRADIKMGHISEDLLTMSEELQMPIIGVGQAQRVSKESELDNDTLAGSIDIARKATKTISMEKKKDSNIIKIKIDKNRFGIDFKSLSYRVDLDKGIWFFEDDGDGKGPSTIINSNDNSQVIGTEGSMRRTQSKDIVDEI